MNSIKSQANSFSDERGGGGLPVNLILGEADGEKLLANLSRFARLLRTVGIRAGPGKVAFAARAIEKVGVAARADFYWTLAAAFLEKGEQRASFHQAFHLFWRAADPFADALSLLAPTIQPRDKNSAARRVAEAMGNWRESQNILPPPDISIDAAMSASDLESLRQKDFEEMSQAEWEAAAKLIRALALQLPQMKTRRARAAAVGRIDRRATFRRALKTGGESLLLRRQTPSSRLPSVVVLCDISGSMNSYARMLAHFMAALVNLPTPIRAFLFGTRLTDASRCLRAGDMESAAAAIGRAAPDWGGGTRIADSIRQFNREWSRRALAQGGVVLLATDGLERGNADELAFQIERLRKSCRRLIWLNPLLRFDRYRAIARGAKILAQFADESRPIHNINSLAQLAKSIGEWK